MSSMVNFNLLSFCTNMDIDKFCPITTHRNMVEVAHLYYSNMVKPCSLIMCCQIEIVLSNVTVTWPVQGLRSNVNMIENIGLSSHVDMAAWSSCNILTHYQPMLVHYIENVNTNQLCNIDKNIDLL